MRNLLVYILSFILGRKTLYNFNLNIIKLFFVFIGNNNFFSFKASGEELFLNKICNESPQLCIDVGANIGNYSKYILENSKSNIIAFEPSKKSYQKLDKLKTKYNSRLFTFNLGLGDKIKDLNLYYDRQNSLWANFNPEVNKIDYLRNNKLIENFDYNILQNYTNRQVVSYSGIFVVFAFICKNFFLIFLSYTQGLFFKKLKIRLSKTLFNFYLNSPYL
jgi:FkbM family methyltransferase